MKLSKSNFLKVAFPHEHGSWGFFLEPIAFALIIGFSINGSLLALASFLLFLSHESSGYVLRRKPKYLLKSAAIIFTLYLIFAAAIIVILIFNSTNITFIYTFIISLIIMIVFKVFESLGLNRNILIELLPQFSITLIAISILLLKDWHAVLLIPISIVMLSRSIQTTVYINAKLKFFKNQSPNKNTVLIIGLFFFIILLIYYLLGLVPIFSIFAILLLIIRAIWGLHNSQKNEKVKIVGIKEFIYGFLFVIINSVGYLYFFDNFPRL